MRNALLLFIALLGGCSNCKNDHDPKKEPQYQGPSKQNHQNAQALLQASQALAADLATAQTLQACHQALKNRVTVQAGTNPDSTFVGIQGMKDALRNRPSQGEGDLNKFLTWAQVGDWKQFGPFHSHYDWWMFPLNRNSTG